MRRVFLLFPLLLNAGVLSSLQEELIQKDTDRAVVSGKKLKDSWINPITLQYKYNRSTQTEPVTQTTNQFIISINQPIFKSGAIWASIKYAKFLTDENLAKVELKKRELIKQAYETIFQIKKVELAIEKQQLLIRNAEIDIKRKREQFLSGVIDSSFLDNAILNKNSLEISLNDLLFQKEELINSFQKLSDLDYNSVKLPQLRLISQNEYLDNLNVKIAKREIDVKHYLKKMNIGNSLVSIDLVGSYNYLKSEYSNQTPIYKDNSKNFYNIGFFVTIPFNINSIKTIEESKIDYLKAVLNYREKIKEEKLEYKKRVDKIKKIDEKIKLYQKSVMTYNSLIETTKENIKAGVNTTLDLETLINSKKIQELNLETLKLEKQIELLNFYYLVGDIE